MKLKNKITSLAIASVLSAPAVMVSAPAHAEMSASFAAANMYLWRGQNLTKDGAAISGSIDYGHESGFYAGAWTSTETEGHETDLYLGFGGEMEGFSYDVSYWKYLYPEDVDGTTSLQVDLGDNDASEFVIGLGYGPVSFTAYMAAESGSDDNNYYTISGDMGQFSLTYGFWDLEKGSITGAQDEYSHIQLGYAATDELSFAVSIASSDLDSNSDTSAIEEDPLFMVMYSKSFDL